MAEHFGWMPNPQATERFVASLPAIYGDQVAALAAGDDGHDCIATITFPVWRQLEFPVEGG